MPPVYVGSSQTEATPKLAPGNMGKRGRMMMLAQHRVARHIMQSEVPASHLAPIKRITVGKRLSEGTRMLTRAYVDNGNSVIEAREKFKGGRSHAQRDNDRRDLVHEIGHANDPETHDRFRSQGRVEATAENYADKYVGSMRTTPTDTYDDPANMALSPLAKSLYARYRVKPQ